MEERNLESTVTLVNEVILAAAEKYKSGENIDTAGLYVLYEGVRTLNRIRRSSSVYPEYKTQQEFFNRICEQTKKAAEKYKAGSTFDISGLQALYEGVGLQDHINQILNSLPPTNVSPAI